MRTVEEGPEDRVGEAVVVAFGNLVRNVDGDARKVLGQLLGDELAVNLGHVETCACGGTRGCERPCGRAKGFEAEDGRRRANQASRSTAREGVCQQSVKEDQATRGKKGLTTKSIFFLHPERAEASPPLETEKR